MSKANRSGHSVTIQSRPDLFAQWDEEANGIPLSDAFASLSTDFTWKCAEGHRWEATVSYRKSNKAGCPVCAGKQVLRGFNDLESKYPQIAAQWHPSKNSVRAHEVMPTSRKVFWWQCTVDSTHEWEASISNRTRHGDSSACPVCVGKIVLPGINDIQTYAPDYLDEWSEKNEMLPSRLGWNSTIKVWWKCNQGHEWRMAPKTRNEKGSGCRECAGKKQYTRHESILIKHPQLAEEWHPTKNEGLSPANVSVASGAKIWWQCDKGHEWQALVHNRTLRKTGCPYCSGKNVRDGETDLLSKHPGIAVQWHPTKNSLQPHEVTAHSHQYVWWMCEKGHEWRAGVYVRTRGNGCPVCGGVLLERGVNDLHSVYPELSAEWSMQNLESPSEVLYNSGKKYWWQCKNDANHVWEASVASRVDGSGCHVCGNKLVLTGHNDLKTLRPDLADEWHSDRNTLRSDEVQPFSKKCVWWQCSQGHEWEAVIGTRSLGFKQCPECFPFATPKVSSPEFELSAALNALDLDVIQSDRASLDNNFELDIFVPEQNFAIEFNGVYWHSEKFKDKNYHQKKHQMCRDKGIYLYQVWEDDWMYRKEIVLRGIAHRLGLTQKLIEVYPELDPRILERLGARKTSVVEVTYAVAAGFLEENHIQGKATGTAYLGLQDENNVLRAVMVLKKSTDNAYLIERYATFGIVPGGFTKLLKYATQILPVDKFVTFSDHSLSDGKLYADNGFIADKVLPPDYSYLVNARRVHKFNYRLKRFREDPNLLFEEGLTETELAALNNLPRIWDSGKTRWVKNVIQNHKS